MLAIFLANEEHLPFDLPSEFELEQLDPSGAPRHILMADRADARNWVVDTFFNNEQIKAELEQQNDTTKTVTYVARKKRMSSSPAREQKVLSPFEIADEQTDALMKDFFHYDASSTPFECIEEEPDSFISRFTLGQKNTDDFSDEECPEYPSSPNIFTTMHSRENLSIFGGQSPVSSHRSSPKSILYNPRLFRDPNNSEPVSPVSYSILSDEDLITDRCDDDSENQAPAPDNITIL